MNHVDYIGGKAYSLHLCDQCANEMFGNFEHEVKQAIVNGLLGDPFRESKSCPACGMRFSEYQRTGLLGCPSCYDVFKDEIMPYIARIQGKTRHVGKGGGVYTSEHDLRLKLSVLQEAMEDALGRGDYIEAGKINEQMNSLKKRDGGGGWRW